MSRPTDSPSTAASAEPSGWTRTLLLLVGIIGVVSGLLLPRMSVSDSTAASEGGVEMVANSLLRIGIVMVALWLALPTLRRPLSWLPPGAAAVCLLMIGIVAARPRLGLVIAPILAFLFSMRWVIRYLR